MEEATMAAKDTAAVTEPWKLSDRLEDRIGVFDSKWFSKGNRVPGFDTVRALLFSEEKSGSDVERQRACLQNILAKLAAPSGDPHWDYWDPTWYGKCRQLLPRQPPHQKPQWVKYCFAGRKRSRSRDSITGGKLIDGISKILHVTNQRVYAQVDGFDGEFRTILEDGDSFLDNEADFIRAHKQPLKDLLESLEEPVSEYRFWSRRERRRRGSLQCVVAEPVSESGTWYADIDIDELNPFADLASLGGHQFQRTDHVKLQGEPYFKDQDHVSYYLELLKDPRYWASAARAGTAIDEL